LHRLAPEQPSRRGIWRRAPHRRREDEADLREVVVEYSRRQGYEALPCPDGRALDAALAAGPVEVVLLDLNLPRKAGFPSPRRLRRQRRCPGSSWSPRSASRWTASSGSRSARDDYIGKPFELRSCWRAAQLLRRREAMGVAHPAAPPRAASPRPPSGSAASPCGAGSGGCWTAQGAEVPLTAMEFDLLLLLAARPARCCRARRCWRLAMARKPSPSTARSTSASPACAGSWSRTRQPRLIRTVRGQGYVFTPDGPAP
jgi:two-component system phosphate regulon response regulator OmpR